ISTPLSDILMFTIESNTLSLTQKRSLLDWVIAPKIRTISGVADLNALGGKVKTYEVIPDLELMRSQGITLETLIHSLEQNNLNDGAGRLTQGVESILVRTVGRIGTIEDIINIPVTRKNAKVITVGDLARVEIGSIARSGFVTKDGKDEAVQGLVLALKGVDTERVLRDVKAELTNIEANLPEGTKLDVFYDRSSLVTLATDTVKKVLLEAIIMIGIVLLLFLGNFASAFSVAIILPFALLMSFIAMEYFGLSANLMSLGGLAIAIGMLVDSAVVMVEHIVSELGVAKAKERSKIDTILYAAKAVAPSIVTGVLIIVIVFLPLMTLEGLEGKLFKPVALSIVFALVSSLILALTFIPMVSTLLLKVRQEKDSFVVRHLKVMYLPILSYCLKHQKTVYSFLLVLVLASSYMYSQIGKTFMPTMDEGNTIIGIEMIPSISLDESKNLNLKIQKVLMSEVKEIESIIARSGSDELGLDPMGLNDTDTFLVLKPQEEWQGKSKTDVLNEMRHVLDDFPGIEYSFTQPIEMRVSEMLTGARGDLAVSVYGSDSMQLEAIAQDVKKILLKTKGSIDVYKPANEGMQYLQIEYKQIALGLYGVDQNQIALFLKTLITGTQVGVVQENLRRINLMLKADETYQHSLSKIENLFYTLEDGSSIPISELVDIELVQGPVLIEHEKGMRKSVVQSSVEGRDLVGFVDEVRQEIESSITMPAGYYVEYGGEFKNQQRAAMRLMLIIPISIFFIFILLFMSFQSVKQALIVLFNIPLALIGGVAGLYFTGEYLSVPASVGFIALLGIAILNGVVLVNYFNSLILQGMSLGDVVIKGALHRVRPVMMTAIIAALGLVPFLFATGPGSELQKPLAIVVVSGLVSSTFLTLILLPMLYKLVQTKKEI
ncbi:MAG: CusA/CzcA family heavy metal efflux RND transporter, partial [Campylobacterota bacterium]|nr:CusA/CzcA family heavy metal efflux RND transporter [Campylobacterota bacterium]